MEIKINNIKNATAKDPFKDVPLMPTAGFTDAAPVSTQDVPQPVVQQQTPIQQQVAVQQPQQRQPIIQGSMAQNQPDMIDPNDYEAAMENFRKRQNGEMPRTVQNEARKCPKCGSSDVELNIATGKLKCSFCHHEFVETTQLEKEKAMGKNFRGVLVSEGAQDIQDSSDEANTVTIKCTGCGAEVVVNLNDIQNVRCHWCRSTLTINSKIPNGANPDYILPFKMTKEQAQGCIHEFVDKRKFFANKVFVREFNTDNILGVYMPYMMVDGNLHGHYEGYGEHLLRRYTVKSGDNEETRYDAEVYQVVRDFDIHIDDLTVESNSERREYSKKKSNNVINAILPFDTENCVEYDSNYLKGFTSERRNANVSEMKPLVDTQMQDVTRYAAGETLGYYDRGVHWTQEQANIQGQKWDTAYLPVWLYSYYQQDKDILHYVAVNARTAETMGSVPLNTTRLGLFTAIITIISIILVILLAPLVLLNGNNDNDIGWLIFALLGMGPGFFAYFYYKYRNTDKSHHHEDETYKTVTNFKQVDNFIQVKKGLRNAQIQGRNEWRVDGGYKSSNILSNVKDKIVPGSQRRK